MRIDYTDSFKQDFRQLPAHIQKVFENKLRLFLQSTKHPSLRVRDTKTAGRPASICSIASHLKSIQLIIFSEESGHIMMS